MVCNATHYDRKFEKLSKVCMKLLVTFKDGSEWEVDPHFIATDYAGWLVGVTEEYTYEENLIYIYGDHDKMIDWAQNNINWADAKQHARQVKPPRRVDYENMWTNSKMEVQP